MQSNLQFDLCTVEKQLKNHVISLEDALLKEPDNYSGMVDLFVSEMVAAEQRILLKQQDRASQEVEVDLYYESILIREFFSYFIKYYNLTYHLSKEQHAVIKRIWCKAFDTALTSSQNIQCDDTIEIIESNVRCAISKIEEQN